VHTCPNIHACAKYTQGSPHRQRMRVCTRARAHVTLHACSLHRSSLTAAHRGCTGTPPALRRILQISSWGRTCGILTRKDSGGSCRSLSRDWTGNHVMRLWYACMHVWLCMCVCGFERMVGYMCVYVVLHVWLYVCACFLTIIYVFFTRMWKLADYHATHILYTFPQHLRCVHAHILYTFIEHLR
jgi:hypothetical protein